MNSEKYVFNTQTLRYEKVVTPTKTKVFKMFGFISSVCLSAFILFALAYFYLPSPKEQALEREITQLEYHYSSLTSELDHITQAVDKLHEKDTDVHRLIFGVEPIDENVWGGGVGGHDKHANLTKYKRSGEVLTSAIDKAERLKRKVDLQLRSVDTLHNLALKREEKFAAIPSIKPVQEDKLKRNIMHLSGFGWRIHPIHKVKKFHKGIDFTAPKGTPIQSTGNGKIVKVSNSRLGYGKSVTIDHGYGYKTLYAHMSRIDVKKGELVKKGEVIGAVGSTGLSTASHLHYEVILHGKHVNPIDYCLDGLTPTEYQELVEKASEENQSFH